jgi:hypothetical protein
MAQVHTFPLVEELLPGFRLPLQYLGTGEIPVASQVEDTVLLAWLIDQLSLSTSAQSVVTGDTIAVTGGNLIECIVVEAAAGSRTIKIGTSAGADDILELTTIPTNTDFTYTMNKYTSTTITLHFTLTGGGASVVLFLKAKT